MKPLHRHSKHTHTTTIVSGIFSGLGEWAEVNPMILRAGYILLAIITGIIPAILVYVALHFMIPKKPQ